MEQASLSVRLTHRYVDTYRHLDSERGVGVLKFTPAKLVREPRDDMSDGGDYVRFARVPAGLSRKARHELVQAARDSFNRHGCHHEYDCCGCMMVRAWPVTLTGRRLRVVLSVGYNY